MSTGFSPKTVLISLTNEGYMHVFRPPPQDRVKQLTAWVLNGRCHVMLKPIF